MSTLNLDPLPATGFRSNNGWALQEFFDTRENVFSNFAFAEQYFAGKESVNTVVRILSLARQSGYKLLVKEKLSDDNSLKNEADAKVRENDLDFMYSEIYRLSFFTCDVRQKPSQDEFLGYAVIKTDYFEDRFENKSRRTYVYESVLKPHHPEDYCELRKLNQRCERNYLHCTRRYEIETCHGKFSVTGAMYAQQNGRDFICAHVALRSVLSLLKKEEDISYDKINEIVGRPLHSRYGLTPTQIDEVLKSEEIKFTHVDSTQFSAMGISSFSQLLYGYIESGCPSLLAFYPHGSNVGHIVPVLGHTFGPDSWVAESRKSYFSGGGGYYSSEGWLDSFIIHDDNFGPYQTLPRNYFGEKDIIHLWGLHNDKKALCFKEVESFALGACWKFILDNKGRITVGECTWYDRFVRCANERKSIFRSLFINKSDYITQIERQGLQFDNKRVLETGLPDKLWMVELSCRELFSGNRAKFGEVLLDINTSNDVDMPVPLVLRLPMFIRFHPPLADETHVTKLTERTPLFT